MVVNADTEDRFELRALVERYAACCDRRRFVELGSLFGAGGRLVVYRDGGAEVAGVRTGADEIARVVGVGLGRYLGTGHMVGAHGAAVAPGGQTGSGETTCRAYHLYERDGERRVMVMSIFYDDTYVREEGRWRFEERHVRTQWREDRPAGSWVP